MKQTGCHSSHEKHSKCPLPPRMFFRPQKCWLEYSKCMIKGFQSLSNFMLIIIIASLGSVCVCVCVCVRVCIIYIIHTHSTRASQVTLVVKNPPARRRKRHRFNPWVGRIPCRRAWKPTLVFLPGESHGQRNLAGYSPYSWKESDTTETT